VTYPFPPNDVDADDLTAGQDGNRHAGPVAATPPPRGRRPNLARVAFWSSLAQISYPVSGIITGPFLARTLGPSGRGVYAAVLAPLLVFGFIAHIGLPDATTYAVARLKLPKGHVVLLLSRLTLLYSILGAAVLYFIAPVLLHKSPEGITLLRLGALTLPAQMILIVLRQATSGSGEFRWRNVERVTSAVLRLVGTVLFAAVGWLSVSSAVWVTIVTGLVGVPILLVALFGWRPQENLRLDPELRRARPHLTRELAAYGLRGWGGVFAYLVNYRLDQAVLVALVSPRELGFYAIAVTLAELPQTAFMQLKNILFAEASARDSVLLVARATRLLLSVTSVMAIGGVLVSPLIIPFMFGHAFRPAIPMAQILFVGTIPFLLDQVLAAGLLSLGMPGRRSFGQLTAACLTVVGLPLLCPTLGGVGAAWTSLAAYSTSATISLVIFRNSTGILYRYILVPQWRDVRWLGDRLLGRVAGRRVNHPPVESGEA
jgi:O-antigen/teichoic acid export membrane protein